MNHKQKLICQGLIAWLVIVSAIAVSDSFDKKTYEDNVGTTPMIETATINSSEKIIEYELSYSRDCQPTIEYTTEIVYKDWEVSDTVNENYEISDSYNDNNFSLESLELPYGLCSNMMFMDFRTLTDTSSKQYELQQYAWTDSQGFRRYGDYYMVAMGTYYGYVGDTFRITTDRGNCYDVILGDCKGYDAVSYDGYRSWYHVCGDGRLNVVEFICDTYCLDSSVWAMGDCGVLDNIGGNIVKIERLE